MSMEAIESKAKVYAAARERLAESVNALNAAIAALQRDHLPGIKRQLGRAFEAENALQALVQANPHLFTKPRTVVLHGVKVGYEKGVGGIEFDDGDQVVALIRKKLPELADVLIVTKESPVKKALNQLTVQQLKAIGCTVREAGDRVVVRAVDSAVDKLVTAMLKGISDQLAQDLDMAAAPG